MLSFLVILIHVFQGANVGILIFDIVVWWVWKIRCLIYYKLRLSSYLLRSCRFVELSNRKFGNFYGDVFNNRKVLICRNSYRSVVRVVLTG